ncbi:signal peptidase I [Candidatus Uhrbacteria bacterium]|nr:signal peptidase I [Candidatus Uhrbacteria bacterium]
MDGQKGAMREGLNFIWELVKIILISIALIVPIRLFLVQPFYVQGASMYPNYIENDYLLIDEITYGLRSPVSHKALAGGRMPLRGETIVFRCEIAQCGNSRGDYLIKRVIGLPGETVVLSDNGVTIKNKEYPQGVRLQEPYIAPGRGYFAQDESDYMLSSNQFFVLGDNRDVSFDSEDFGPIPFTAIVGKVFFRGWPFTRVTIVTTPSYPL